MKSLIQSWFGRKNTEKRYAVESYNIGMEDVQLVVRSMQSKIRKGVMMDFHKILLVTTIGAEFTPSYHVLDWKKEDGIPLIIGTLTSEEEETVINGMLEDGEEGMNENTQHSEDGMMLGLDDVLIVVYGQGSGDESVLKKVKLLRSLGFENTFCYLGGMMEWLLLRDIYGDVEFPLCVGGGGGGGGDVSKNVDPLFYKMERKLV